MVKPVSISKTESRYFGTLKKILICRGMDLNLTLFPESFSWQELEKGLYKYGQSSFNRNLKFLILNMFRSERMSFNRKPDGEDHSKRSRTRESHPSNINEFVLVGGQHNFFRTKKNSPLRKSLLFDCIFYNVVFIFSWKQCKKRNKTQTHVYYQIIQRFA